MPKLPTYNGPRFGGWLTRWKDAEGLQWQEIADRAGLHVSQVHKLRRGAQDSARRNAGGPISPSAETLARLAHGLQIELPYLLTKTGLLDNREGSRWRSFTLAEREALRWALRENGLPGVSERLLSELENIDQLEGGHAAAEE